MNDENLFEKLSMWEYLNQTPEVKIAYESRLKAILDEEARLSYVREKSLKEGIAEGKKQGIEEAIKNVAKKMIAKGKSNEDIIDATDLTLPEVEALREEM